MKANRTLILNALLIVILFVSCSSPSDSTNESPLSEQQIIGTPIKIGNFEVAKNDFPKKMTWYKAKKACTDLGKGWRLPTKDELNLMFENKDIIDGFSNYYYWSSTEMSNYGAWGQSFNFGYQNDYGKHDYSYVRAVRSF